MSISPLVSEGCGSPQVTLRDISICIRSISSSWLNFDHNHSVGGATLVAPVNAPGTPIRVSDLAMDPTNLVRGTICLHRVGLPLPRPVLVGQTPCYAIVIPLCCPDAREIISPRDVATLPWCMHWFPTPATQHYQASQMTSQSRVRSCLIRMYIEDILGPRRKFAHFPQSYPPRHPTGKGRHKRIH